MDFIFKSFVLTTLCLALTTSAHSQCADYSGGGAGITPVELSLAPNGAAEGFELVGSNLWVARNLYGGLVCVDVIEPEAPVELGSVSFGDEAYNVAIEGDLACVTFLNWAGPVGIQLVDITDPTAPTLRGAITDRLAYAVEVVDGLAYMAGAYDGGVTVVDLADPDNPVVLGSAPTAGTCLSVVVSGTRAYVGSRDWGIHVVDISDPNEPVWVGYARADGEDWHKVTVHEMQIEGNLLYAAASQAVEIYDLSDPDSPLLIGSCPTPGLARGIHVAGPIAYVSDNTAGIHWMSVLDPQAPAIIASYPISGWSRHLVPMGDHILLSNDSVFVLPDQCMTSPTPAPVPELTRHSIRVSPNPFNPATTIYMVSPRAGLADLRIFTIDGRLVRRLAAEWRDAGAWAVRWDGLDDEGIHVASGTYLARLRVGTQTVATKMSCIK